MMKIYCNVCSRYRKSKNPKIYIFKKTLCLSVIYRKCGHEYKKMFKEEEESIEVLKILGLITNTEECQKMYNHD